MTPSTLDPTSPRVRARKLRSIAGRRRRISPGWNCRPKTRSRSTALANVAGPCVVVATVHRPDRCGVRVREVGLRVRRDAGEQRRRPRRAHRVPADVRHLEVGPRGRRSAGRSGPTPARAAGTARQQPETGERWRLGAALEQPLQAETDAEQRAARCAGARGSRRATPRRAPPWPRSGRRPAR